ncbi:sulfurtransferase TusA family protein [Segatella copri]|jgi:sulfite reductase (ferredoxin)|uniref:Sulfurtransferase TusA family protein n=1 Tax=Segatella copri TaxID=165179 RepID=A0AAP2TLH8_9BACT|nr:sulfurtransferase TusA family protein [Segatella copri]MCF0066442.1 sulfurtransferase TusA family protein [Segatella copri]MCP9457928.1 sulfurtransferase TusA family protein [Segatella copri]MCP9500557.1 sulfurtransferase TusA family protein [Segatella copri]MCP9503578.1 sulfurtransferase TusA family protein [Segatella copri]MCP9506535.1 sulfurtransferase TusA family protein [Segatella copri]
MYRIPSTLNGDLDYTQSLIDQFKAGEIQAGQLKSNRVPMGIYEQRKNQHYMLRLRCAGGLVTPEQLAKIAFVGHQLSTSHLHVTTRQEIQIHNVDIEDAIPALKKLEKVGISSAGGGGNTVRNMMVDDRSGLTADEEFDVYPYVEELTSRLIAEKDSFTMPRKYKVAIDTSVATANYSYIADLGLQARIKDGQRGFRVLIAGSAASNAHTGWEVFDFLPEKDLYRAAKALKNWFHKYGNRRNRHKARMRYVFYKYGTEEAKRLYLEEFEELKKDGSIDFEAPALPLEHHKPNFPPLKAPTDFETWKRRYAHKQTNAEGLKENLWYAYIPLRHGNNSTDFFAEVAEYLGNYGNDVIRFTKKEQIQVRNIPEEYLTNIYAFFKKLGVYQIDYPVVVTNLTCCTGADTCRLGICLPKGAIDGIAKQLLNSNLNLDAIPDFELRMNGCTNICALATWGDLGFSGRVGRVGDDPYPAYTIWLPVKGKHEIDLQQGYIAAKKIPAFVEDYLRDVIAEQTNYADYYDYVAKRGVNIVKELIAKYKEVAPYSEEPDTFFDFGDDEKFSLIKYGKAECSAGLFDIIEIDQDTIREKRKEVEQLLSDGKQNTGKIEKLLHDIVFSENRMLLVTRGLDPRTDEDVYNGFEKEFIAAGIIPQKFKVLTDKARNNESLIAEKPLIDELADLLNDLYQNMDDSLQFKLPAEKTPVEQVAEEKNAEEKAPAEQVSEEKAPAEKASAAEETETIVPDVKKDFRGVMCPMNFVKTKIALTPMQSGQILEILLDDGAPIENVPGSVKNEGHTILSTEKVENYWKVLIKKK